jgi:hypothetical protein
MRVPGVRSMIKPLVDLVLELSGNGRLLLQNVYNPLPCLLVRTYDCHVQSKSGY